MGDIGVDIFLERLKELITTSKLDLITNEKQQLVSLEEEIKYLRGFLKVTEKKRNEHSEILKLVKKIRGVVSDAEDIVELFVIDAFEADDSYFLCELFNDQDFLSLDLEGVEKENDQDSLSLDLEGVEKENDQDSLSLDLEGVKKEIKTLMAEVKKIYEENMDDINGEAVKKLMKHSSTGIGSGGGLRSSGGSNTSKVVKEKVVVGFEEEVKRLMEKLYYGGEELEIVTIIGAGGGGKTTLAREVYDNPSTSYNFEIRAWVNVSQDYDKTMKRDLLITILKSASPEKHEDYEELITTLKSLITILKSASLEKHKDYEELITTLKSASPQKHEDYEKLITILKSASSPEKHEDYEKLITILKSLITILKSASPEKHEDYEKLITILKSASQEKHEDYEKLITILNKISEDKLGEKVLKCLKCKRYLIVMDDVWGIEAWNDIRRSFPNECNGSRVLFTSRLDIEKVVQHDSVHCTPYRLAPLSKCSSWELLQKKVFGGEPCPQELKEIGEQIAGKCGGLPLAIVAIAGILATEDKTLKLWKEVAERLSLIIEKKNQEGCMEVLELSYNHLPLHLKACFLYIGAFPEDCEIPVHELIWLWIAEGFIQQSEGGKSLEAVAEDYLIDLVDRSLVMVARKGSLGEIKACRIHDLLRVLCSKKAEEDNFFVQIYGDDSFSASATSKHRRLFIGCQSFYKYSLRPQDRNLHSIVCPGLPTSNHLQKLSSVLENFKLLKVLNVISTQCVGEIKIGHPLPLRYLAFKFSDSYTSRLMRRHDFFPEDFYNFPYDEAEQHPNLLFSNLLNLETLYVRAPLYKCKIPLPRDIFKMVKLRHLYSNGGVFNLHEFRKLSHEERAEIFSDHSSKLDSLQTLHHICSCYNCRSILERTPNLRKLGLVGKKPISHAGVLMLPDVGFLKCLDTLSFKFKKWSYQSERVPYTFPAGLKFPPSVTRLTLGLTFLKWEELSLLQTLPNLEVLKLLEKACRGPVWDTTELEEGFSQLKYLYLKFLDIEKWEASEDQFPLLEVLVVDFCPELEQIPMDFANLMELRELQVGWSSRSAEESARKIQEERKNKNGDDDCLNLLCQQNCYPSKALKKHECTIQDQP